MTQKTWNVYLSGEIHTDWRERIIEGTKAAGLAVEFSSAVTDHDASDMVGVNILGSEEDNFWRDRKASGINSIRTSTQIKAADLVVVRFGPKYRQWNAAFDAGFAVASGKPIVTLHDAELDHPLKEVDEAAKATCREPEQVVEILTYLLS
ncbi:YtoQ family protein [Oceanisphaera pacifica]|uniref:YtoQ family protein n=1 Tax=Oceanisphaera pacifica TaxID=2818389 RepID=A0ABS3NDC2_9GAMM|nr:YtoQ family protein [Oceanisphaera pacifica]MBO1518594.1 YtoQ family protein [Oceanisphaera pacifica]